MRQKRAARLVSNPVLTLNVRIALIRWQSGGLEAAIERQKSANKVWEPSRRDFNNCVGFGFAGDLDCGDLQRKQLSWPPAGGFCLQNQAELSHLGPCERLAQLMLGMNG